MTSPSTSKPTVLVDCPTCGPVPKLPSHGSTSIRCAACGAPAKIASRPQQSSLTPSPHPQLNPPSAHGRKRAVIVGISYKGTRFELNGCLNDAKCMRYLLVKRFNFPEASIRVLTEEEKDDDRKPTKRNLLRAMNWLVQGCQSGDSLFFHYSGHGSQMKDDNGDEIDGYDETLCPMDFETQGMILDDDINEMMVRPLPKGAKLHAIIDACHSGTVLDLPYLCRMNWSGLYLWEDHRPKSGNWKGTSGGECISFSGCDDNQTSADTEALSKSTSTGAMTYSFIQAIESGADTYGSILKSMRMAIEDTSINGGRVSKLILKLLNRHHGGGNMRRQEPQLTSNEPFDVFKKQFSL